MDFPSNSQMPNQPPEKKIEKVITGEVSKVKKPISQRFKNIFVRGEFRQAVSFVVADVLLPATKNLIVDATSKGIERLIYGDTTPRRNRAYGATNTTRVLYNSPIDRYSSVRPSLPGQPPLGPLPSRRVYDDDIILSSASDANTTLERLHDLIDQYDAASVADLNELLGLPSTFVDNSWGWTDLHGAEVVQTRDGYLLRLPPHTKL